jgi:CheY-like chemotaxis protein
LVALADRDQATAASAALVRLGYPVDSAEDGSDAARHLEQGVYALVATTRGFSAQGQAETLYQRITRLGPDQRRRVFAILVGDEFRSGDGAQAFVLLADLVLNARDLAAADNLIRGTVGERRRIYTAFHEARARLEAASTV